MTDDVKEITFVAPEVQRCPFPVYKRLHAHPGVHRDPKTGFFELVGYEDLFKVAQDHKTYSSEHPVYGDRSLTPAKAEVDRLYAEQGYIPVPTLINADEPTHTMYRSLVEKSFRPARVKSLEPYILELSNKLIDDFPATGPVDFVAQFALLLPLFVIADTLGVERKFGHDFKRWSDALMKVHEPGIDAAQQIALTHEVIEMQQFFAAALERARSKPGENILGDLAVAQVEGRALSVGEAVALLQSILVAGNETTTNALGSSMLRLVQNPKIEQRLRQEPNLVPAFAEEVLRIDSPLQCQFRRPVRNVELNGTAVPADSMVVLRFGGGNRDEKRFPHADTIDLERPGVRQHLAFGVGIHSCLGSILARAELRIALQTLLTRLRDFKLAGEPQYEPSYLAYGPRSLPITFSRV